MEEWRDIVEFPSYQVSNYGRVRSLDREVNGPRGPRQLKGKIIKTQPLKSLYCIVTLRKSGKTISKYVHHLVAETFLNHTVSREIQIDHIDSDKMNNRLDNLQILTRRENCAKTIRKIRVSSKYVGVYWRKNDKKWAAQISINGKKNHIGVFDDEYEAYLAYQEKLKEIENI